MKKLAILILLCFSHSLFAQGDGIQFKKNTPWADVLNEAKQSGKLIFVDVYTETCAPCVNMDNHIFPKKEVGDVYNSQFINYKLDAEKGEGPSLAKNYHVTYYPTYLFIDGDGALIYRSGSFMEADVLINQSKMALKERSEGVRLADLQNRYDAEKNDKAFMYSYVRKNTDLQSNTHQMLEAYIALLDPQERAEKKNLQLIIDNGSYLNDVLQLGTAMDVLEENQELFPELLASKDLPSENFKNFFNRVVNTTLAAASSQNNRALLNRALKYKPSAAESFLDNKETIEIEFLRNNGTDDSYFKALKKYVEQQLFKISTATLLKSDQEVYDESIKSMKASSNSLLNDAEYIKSLEHTQTIRLTNYVMDQAGKALELELKAGDKKRILKWYDQILRITEIDPTYFKNVLPNYHLVAANSHYKLGNKAKTFEIINQLESEFANNKMALNFLSNVRKKYEN